MSEKIKVKVREVRKDEITEEEKRKIESGEILSVPVASSRFTPTMAAVAYALLIGSYLIAVLPQYADGAQFGRLGMLFIGAGSLAILYQCMQAYANLVTETSVRMKTMSSILRHVIEQHGTKIETDGLSLPTDEKPTNVH